MYHFNAQMQIERDRNYKQHPKIFLDCLMVDQSHLYDNGIGPTRNSLCEKKFVLIKLAGPSSARLKACHIHWIRVYIRIFGNELQIFQNDFCHAYPDIEKPLAVVGF